MRKTKDQCTQINDGEVKLASTAITPSSEHKPKEPKPKRSAIGSLSHLFKHRMKAKERSRASTKADEQKVRND